MAHLRWAILLFFAAGWGPISLQAAQPEGTADQAAIRQAIAAVAPSVVQITTVGGLDRVGGTEAATGPTTGLIITADGYIVSSAFNFAHHPSSILVRSADGAQFPATLVARDSNRMLVLLKVETATELPIPVAVPTRELAVGQTALALGRTFQSEGVDTSLGIVSALGRMHGRVLQTDASISAANYGGPLIDLRGRVFGVLVPMAPQQDPQADTSEVAGSEFYDSGIGFAVPLEHVLSILDRWQTQGDLQPGRLGIAFRKGSPFVEPPQIATVWPGSPADQAGWQVGDTILAVDGLFVQTQSQLQFLIKPHYAGDELTLTLRRRSAEDGEEFESAITLAGEMPAYRTPFLGVLPALVPTAGGVAVGGVWPGSPAAEAGLQPGDLLTKLGKTPTPNHAAAVAVMQGFRVGQQIAVQVERGGQELQLTPMLARVPEAILASNDLPPLAGVPQNAEKPAWEELKLPQFPRAASVLLPKLPKGASPGLLLVLADGNGAAAQTQAAGWQGGCEQYGLALLVAQPASESGWETDDLEYLDQLVRTAQQKYRLSPQQTVLVGRDKAGQLAYALALRRQQSFAGVVADNAPLPRTLKLPETSPARQLAILSALPPNSPFLPLVKQDITSLRAAGYAVSTLERNGETTSPEFDAPTRATILRWIAGLRRL